MTFEAAFEELWSKLHDLRDVVRELQTIVQDRPVVGASKPMDDLDDSVTDLVGLVQETVTSGAAAQQALEDPLDVDKARRHLSSCHVRFNMVLRRFFSDISSHRRLEALAGSSKERRGEWRGWFGAVQDSLDRCTEPIYATNRALLACWQEMAQRAGTSVAVQTTNIGQQIAFPEEREAIGERVT